MLVRLHAAALNHRDLYVAAGGRTPAGHTFVLGSDGAGTIEAIGPGVREAGVGDHVLVYPSMRWGNHESAPGPGFEILGGAENGTFAQYIILPLENVRRKPDHFCVGEAAALPLAGLTAYRALLSGRIAGGGRPCSSTGSAARSRSTPCRSPSSRRACHRDEQQRREA